MIKPDSNREWYNWLRYKIDKGKGECIIDTALETHEQSDGSSVHMRLLVWKPHYAPPSDDVFSQPIFPGMPLPTEEERERMRADLALIFEQGSLYWGVHCEPPCTEERTYHPFICTMDETAGQMGISEMGGIVVDNAVTRTLLEHLAKTDQEWVGHLGSDSVESWRGRLIKCLTLLWE